MEDKKYLVGVYNDDEVLIDAVNKVRGNGVKILEVFTPYPVHGLDRALGYAYPRMGIAAFLFGLTGLCCAAALTMWTLGVDWPMNIGGKNFVPFPTNVPIMFEGTVLFAAFGMAFTFFVMEDLGPTAKPMIFDLRSTDDKFVMAVDLSKNSKSENEIAQILKESGAEEVNVKMS